MDRIDRVLQNNGTIFCLIFCSSIALQIATKDFFLYSFYAMNEGAPPSRDSESQQQPTVDDANVNPRYPSPDVLASVIERAQQLLSGSAASALSVCYLSSVPLWLWPVPFTPDSLRVISCSSKVFASLVMFC